MQQPLFITLAAMLLKGLAPPFYTAHLLPHNAHTGAAHAASRPAAVAAQPGLMARAGAACFCKLLLLLLLLLLGLWEACLQRYPPVRAAVAVAAAAAAAVLIANQGASPGLSMHGGKCARGGGGHGRAGVALPNLVAVCLLQLPLPLLLQGMEVEAREGLGLLSSRQGIREGGRIGGRHPAAAAASAAAATAILQGPLLHLLAHNSRACAAPYSRRHPPLTPCPCPCPLLPPAHARAPPHPPLPLRLRMPLLQHHQLLQLRYGRRLWPRLRLQLRLRVHVQVWQLPLAPWPTLPLLRDRLCPQGMLHAGEEVLQVGIMCAAGASHLGGAGEWGARGVGTGKGGVCKGIWVHAAHEGAAACCRHAPCAPVPAQVTEGGKGRGVHSHSLDSFPHMHPSSPQPTHQPTLARMHACTHAHDTHSRARTSSHSHISTHEHTHTRT